MSSRLPSDNLAYAVLLSINEGKSLGSGIRMKYKGRNYLITAKHVLYNRRDELCGTTLIVTCHSADKAAKSPTIIQVDLDQAEVFPSDKFDFAAVLIGENIPIEGHDHKTPLKKLKTNEKRPTQLVFKDYATLIQPGSGDVFSLDTEATGSLKDAGIANDVYLMGYPTSLGMRQNKFYNFSKPLVRKGIIAGIDEDNMTFVIDCPAYPGNSGGPVVEHCKDGYFRVTGIVSKYIPYETKWHSNREDITNTDIANSGYTICIAMDPIISLLSSIPTGPKSA